MVSRLKLTLACGDYDQTKALMDGTVKPEGIDLIYLTLPQEEIFLRMIRFKEFHVSEMSFSSYLLNLSRGNNDFIAIPVFLSRMFSHSSIEFTAEVGDNTLKFVIRFNASKPTEILAGEQACYNLLAFICLKMKFHWRSNPTGKVRYNLPFFQKLAQKNFPEKFYTKLLRVPRRIICG